MKTMQQKFISLKEKIKVGQKVTRILLVLLLFSLVINTMTITKLQEIDNNNKSEETIFATGIVEKIDSSTFVFLPDND